MYRPETRIIRHGLADVKFRPPDMDREGWQQINKTYLDQQEKRYKETNDLYDLQTEQANEMNRVLEGTSGADYEYLQRSIVESRDQLKALYKGKKLKDTRSPEFQTQLYNIYQGLGNKKNSINSFHEQVKAANAMAAGTPSVKKKEWQDYVNAQATLPPDQRDRNLVNKLNTDNLFYNSYDATKAVLESEKMMSEQIAKEQDDLILNYDASYRPSLGKFDKKTGEFKYAPADEIVDRLLASDKRFFNAMSGMLPPNEAKALTDSGNTTAMMQAVRDQAKKFITTVAQQQGYGYDLGKAQIRVNPDVYKKDTTYDKKVAKEEEELAIIHNRIMEGDSRAFNDFLSKDFWQSFDYEYGSDGVTPVAVIGSYKTKDRRNRNDIIVTERIEVDPTDPGVTKQAINRIKAAHDKNKQNISVKPLAPQKTYINVDGSKITFDQLSKKYKAKGYSDQQIQDAIKAAIAAGKLKE